MSHRKLVGESHLLSSGGQGEDVSVMIVVEAGEAIDENINTSIDSVWAKCIYRPMSIYLHNHKQNQKHYRNVF